LESWLKQIREHAPQDILIVIIGTKCDLPTEGRKVSPGEGQAFASKQGLKFFEVSAKENTNIENLFEHLGR
jgi:GTPase SAR1 family protein